MPSDESASPGPHTGAARRLHPASWIFLALAQLKAFLLPLVLLLVTGRGDAAHFIGLVGVGGVALAAAARYLSFSYRLGPNSVVVTNGILERTRRDIPYERIHDVIVHQSLLHRLFGVAEVRLESASGQAAEAEMKVLSLADAHDIETIVRGHTVAAAGTEEKATAPAAAASTTLLTLGPGEVLRLGLITNRGWVLVAAVIGGLWQVVPDEVWGDLVEFVGMRLAIDDLRGPWWLQPPGVTAAIALALLCLAIVLIRALSVVLAFLQFHGFTLAETKHRLRVERGLLTRIRHHVPLTRIQAWRIDETLLHRWFGRQSLNVDSAASPSGADTLTGSVAPIAPPAYLVWLVEQLLPGLAWPPAAWHPLHPLAWRRLVIRPLVLVAGIAAMVSWQLGSTGLLILLAAPGVVVWATRTAASGGYAELAPGIIAVRQGWLSRSWRFAEITKLQTLRISQTPFDRRYGMATVWLDTAGASTRGKPFRVPFLPIADARALYARLTTGLDDVR